MGRFLGGAFDLAALSVVFAISLGDFELALESVDLAIGEVLGVSVRAVEGLPGFDKLGSVNFAEPVNDGAFRTTTAAECDFNNRECHGILSQ